MVFNRSVFDVKDLSHEPFAVRRGRWHSSVTSSIEFHPSSPPGPAGPAARDTLLLCGRFVGTDVGILVRSAQVSFLLVTANRVGRVGRLRLGPGRGWFIRPKRVSAANMIRSRRTPSVATMHHRRSGRKPAVDDDTLPGDVGCAITY